MNDWLKRALGSRKRGDHERVLQACATAPRDAPSQMTAHALRASSLAKLGRSNEALRDIDAALRLGADSTELCRLAATICIARDDLGAARAWIDRALHDTPPPRALLDLRREIVARMHLLSGMHDHQELVVRLDPHSVEAREGLIVSYLTLGAYDLAEAHLDIALAQCPARVALHIHKAVVDLGMGRTAEAAGTLQRALTLAPGVAERVHIASLFIKAGALGQALRTAEETRRLTPDAAEVRLQSGWFALWQGDSGAAERACCGLPASTPGLARLRAAIAFVAGQHDAALALATTAVAHDPTDAEAQAVRAAALLRLGRYEEANRSALTALWGAKEWLPAAHLARAGANPAGHEVAELCTQLAPLMPEVVSSSSHDDREPSRVVLDAVRTALDRLSGNFSSTLTFVPEGARTWSSFAPKPPARVACVRVANLINIRPWRWVAERLRLLGEDYPDSPLVHTYTAEVWLWAGDYPAAEAECREALALIRTTRWAWIGLGAALMLQGRHEAALDVFAESNQLLVPGAPLLSYRGETLRRCGQLAAARADLERALTLAPTLVSSWLNLGLLAASEGRAEEVRDIAARLDAHMPELVRDIQRDLRRGAADAAAPSPVAIFEQTLLAMRGNRSSQRITYVGGDGEVRTLRARALLPTSGATAASTPR